MDDADRLLADGAAVMLAVLERDATVARINPAVLPLAGQTPKEVEGRPVFDLVHDDDVDGVRAAFERCLTERRRVTVSHRLLRGREQPRTCEMVFAPVGEGSELEGVHASCYDVSSHRRHEQVLETSQALFHTVFETAGEAIIATDEDHHIVLFNRAAARLFDYEPDEVLGRNVDVVLPGGAPASDASKPVEATGRRRDGETFAAEVMVAQQMLDGRPVITGVVHNVTDRRRREAELDRRAHHDPLTDLPNRATLDQHLAQVVASAGRTDTLMAVLFVDLDGFKDVNDEHGHDVGDRLLQGVARRLERSVRASDIVARWGGDEFVIVLSHVAREGDAIRIAEVVRRRIGGRFHIMGLDLQLTTSVGVSLYPADGVTADALLRRADEAMYAAKQAGKNRVHRTGRDDGR